MHAEKIDINMYHIVLTHLTLCMCTKSFEKEEGTNILTADTELHVHSELFSV